MAEKFDIKKFFDLSPTALGKVLSIGWKLLLVLFLVFTIWRAWFTKPQTQQTKIKEVKGNVNIIQKQSRFLIPFVEVFVEQKRDSDMNTGVRVGIRKEF